MRCDTLWFFLRRIPDEVDAARGSARDAYLVFWPYRYSLGTALVIFSVGGALGRLVYWQLWERGAVTRKAP
jgi:hypothetical protein